MHYVFSTEFQVGNEQFVDYVVGSESVWSKVLAMEDRIRVNYNAVEELFCQKQVKVEDKPDEKKKPPKEVIISGRTHVLSKLKQ